MIKEIKQFGDIESNDSKIMSVFLAGGITNVEVNWQAEVISYLNKFDNESKHKDKYTLLVYNPREVDDRFKNVEDMSLKNIINWDCEAIESSTILSFYFASGSAAQTSSQFELARYLTLLQISYNITTLADKLIVNIGKDYIGKEKLSCYLNYIFKDFTQYIVFQDQSIENHAKRIYDRYISFIENPLIRYI